MTLLDQLRAKKLARLTAKEERQLRAVSRADHAQLMKTFGTPTAKGEVTFQTRKQLQDRIKQLEKQVAAKAPAAVKPATRRPARKAVAKAKPEAKKTGNWKMRDYKVTYLSELKARRNKS